jgi:MFS family permease
MTAATPVTPATRARGGFCLAVTGTVVLMAAASAPSPFYPQLTEQLQLPPVATTLIFAIYAIPLLLALLTLGSLSDRVGRRGILTVGSVALSVSLLMFWAADSFLLLLAARALQGLAAGLLVPVLNAMMVDHEPSRWLGAAALANTVAPMAGLGLGALTAAGLLDLPGIDAGTIFLLLAAVFPLLAATAWTIPTPPVLPGDAGPDPRARRVSAATRRRIIVSVAPAIIAGWVTNGLFLALGPGIIATRFHADTYLHQAGSIIILAAAGVVAATALQGATARRISVFGAVSLGAGTVLSLAALAVPTLPGYLASVAVVGAGFDCLHGRDAHPAAARRPRAARHRYGRDLHDLLPRDVRPRRAGRLPRPRSHPPWSRGRVGGVVVLLSITATLTHLRTPTELTPPATQHRPKGTRRP